MIDRERLRARMLEQDLSQSELGRRVGVSQATIYKLLTGESYGTKHLHLIARELGTTPAYLTGEIDDPDDGAPPPVVAPRTQLVMMPVGMPSEEALADMYEGQLRVFAKLSGAELARALAKRLPKALARLQSVELYLDVDHQPEDIEDALPLPTDRPLTQRSQRK